MAAVEPNTNGYLSDESDISSIVPDSPDHGEDDGAQNKVHYADSSSDDSDDNSDSDDETELNFSFNIRYTLPHKVRKTDTVRKLKREFHQHGGIPKARLNRFFARHGLTNQQTFREAIPILCREIVIRIPTHSELNTSITVFINDTIASIKSRAMRKVGLEGQSQYFDVMFNGVFLKTHITLESVMRMTDDHITFFLIQRPLETIRIVMMTPQQRFPLTFEVKKLNTVWDAKMIAGSVLGINVERAALMMTGHPDLNENRTFESLNVRSPDYFLLVFPIKVNVRLLTGDLISVDVLPSQKVDDLNSKVTKSMSDPLAVYPYYFRGEKLLVGRPLHSYAITEGCIIAMGHPTNN